MVNTYKIRRVGGALVVTIPQEVARFAELKAGDMVSVAVTKQKLIMIRSAMKPKPRGK